MSKFRFSKRSLSNLQHVAEPLVRVVHRALQITEVDFVVIEGLRTVEQQRKHVQSGASQTMNSKHLTGDAVDLMAWAAGRASWEMPYYFKIAEAMRLAAIEEKVSIRWGGAWTVQDLPNFFGTAADAYESYVDTRRKQGRRPFIDGPHFELS